GVDAAALAIVGAPFARVRPKMKIWAQYRQSPSPPGARAHFVRRRTAIRGPALACLSRYADDTPRRLLRAGGGDGRRADRVLPQAGPPFGLNAESVSIRKVETEASVRLPTRLGAELRR
ncbi:MAG: hypothetical protein WA862_03900, partial [Solirubrobacterales bacterium]